MTTEVGRFGRYYDTGMIDTQTEGFLDKLDNPRYLPTLTEVSNRLDFKNLARGAFRNSVWTDWDVFQSLLSYSVYEFFTREHLERLSNYLAGRIDQIGKTKKAPVVILDPCAGNGRLPYFLDEKLAERMDRGKFKVVASDDRSWTPTKDENKEHVYEVANLDYQDATLQFHPHIIVASWIPSSRHSDLKRPQQHRQHRDETAADWMAFFRARGIEEQILIGKPDLLTRYDTKSDKLVDASLECEQDGYQKVIHDNWQKYQLCAYDRNYHERGTMSTTISFIRQPLPTS